MSDAVLLLVGIFAIGIVVTDLFFVVSPRSSRVALSWHRALAQLIWPAWRGGALLIRKPWLRQAVLSTFAPAFLFFFLLSWLVLLIVGYGCLFYVMHDHLLPPSSFGSAVYFAGVSLLTIGYGDILPINATARVIAICAGATGVGLFSLTTSFLFSIFGSFRRREPFVTLVGTRTGAPCSGIAIVETYARLGILDQVSEVLLGGEQWASAVVDSHLAYPVLMFFRTNDPDLSWVGTLVALLDASALLVTTVQGARTARANFMLAMGRHVTKALSRKLEFRRTTGAAMDRSTFERGLAHLHDIGIALHDGEESWVRFCAARSSYIGPLMALANYLAVPSGEWFAETSLADQAGSARA